MKKCLSVRARTVVSLAACCILLSACVSRELFTGYHGVVYDSTTGRPMEGVYVMAAYLEGGIAKFGGDSAWCVKSVGMYTGSDGKFSFPGSFWSPNLYAIKLGYFRDLGRTVRERRARGGDDFGPPYDLYMTPQPQDNRRISGYVSCWRARKAADVMANIEYLEILGAEDRKYRGNSEVVDGSIHSLRESFDIAEPLKAQPANSKNQ